MTINIGSPKVQEALKNLAEALVEDTIDTLKQIEKDESRKAKKRKRYSYNDPDYVFDQTMNYIDNLDNDFMEALDGAIHDHIEILFKRK